MTAGAKEAGVGSGESHPRGPLLELGLGAAWLVGLAAMLSMVDQLLGPGSMGAAILGALAIDLLAKRAGVRWDHDELGIDSPRHIVRRVATGAGVALVAGALAIGVAGALGWFHGHGPQISSALVFAAVRSTALAVRDELLFCGIPLAAAARARIPAAFAQGFAGLTSGAAIALVPGATPAAVALAVASGWLFAVLWTRDRGAWAAVGAHAAWLMLLGSVIHGGLFDLDWTAGELAAGAHAAGRPAWLAAATLAAVAVALRWLPRPAGVRHEPGG